ncbi:Ig-like domain-containing protein, partial [Thermodesulfobacteriota bacterium]
DTITVNVTINPRNDLPTANGDTDTVAEDSVDNPMDVLANDTIDPDTGETLTITSLSRPPNGTAAITGPGTGLTYTPDPDFSGVDTFTYTINDGTPGSDDTASVEVTVTNSNDPPNPIASNITTDEDTPGNSIIHHGDPDIGDTHTYAVTIPPDHGTALAASGGSATYTPTQDYHGPDSFTVTVTDSAQESDSVRIAVTVTPVNDPPAITGSPPTSVLENELYSFTPQAADVDAGDTLSFSIANMPGWAKFKTSTGTLSGVPGRPDVGIHTGIVITVMDSAGASASLPPFDITVVQAVMKGDVDDDGAVDLRDAIISSQVVQRVDVLVPIFKEADVNGDKVIGVAEIVYGIQVPAGLRP